MDNLGSHVCGIGDVVDKSPGTWEDCFDSALLPAVFFLGCLGRKEWPGCLSLYILLEVASDRPGVVRQRWTGVYYESGRKEVCADHGGAHSR